MRIHFILQHNMLFRYSLGHLGLYLLCLLCIVCNFLQVDIHFKVLNWYSSLLHLSFQSTNAHSRIQCLYAFIVIHQEKKCKLLTSLKKSSNVKDKTCTLHHPKTKLLTLR